LKEECWMITLPVGGVLQPATAKVPIALVPQDIPATAVFKEKQLLLQVQPILLPAVILTQHLC